MKRVLIAVVFAVLVLPVCAQEPAAALRVGEPAPAIHLKKLLQAPAGSPTTLAGLKGKAVVLEFWATWCAPCVAAFPHLNEMVEETKGDPLVFIAVTDESEEKVAAFLEKKKLATWVGLDDKRATMTAYGVKAIPRTVLIGPGGVVRAVTHPTNVDAAVLKDLAHGRPLAVRAAPEAETIPAMAGGEGAPGLDLDSAGVLLYFGPAGQPVGAPTASPWLVKSPRTSLRSIVSACSGVSMRRVMLAEGVVDEEYGYVVRVPKGSGLAPYELLRQAVEAAARVHAVREQREMDVLVMTHPGPGAPKKAEGDAALGSMVMGNEQFTRGENARIADLCGWVEQATNKPVVNETGLEGSYDWEFAVKSPGVEDLSAKLGKVGLRLTPERRKMEVVVVRRAEGQKQGAP